MIILIAAMTKNRVIGYQNKMPWHLPSELTHFRTTTNVHTVLLGRKTYDAIGGLLPNRHHIIVTSNPHLINEPNATVTSDLFAMLETWKKKKEPLFVIGGAQIYAKALPFADEIILSVIKGEYEGDTYFPNFSLSDFPLLKKEEHDGFTVYYYTRKI